MHPLNLPLLGKALDPLAALRERIIFLAAISFPIALLLTIAAIWRWRFQSRQRLTLMMFPLTWYASMALAFYTSKYYQEKLSPQQTVAMQTMGKRYLEVLAPKKLAVLREAAVKKSFDLLGSHQTNFSSQLNELKDRVGSFKSAP